MTTVTGVEMFANFHPACEECGLVHPAVGESVGLMLRDVSPQELRDRMADGETLVVRGRPGAHGHGIR